MKKVLVAETSASRREKLCRLLNKDGITVVCRPCVHEIQDAVADENPDLLFISASLTEEEMLNCVRGSRQISATLPIIVATDTENIRFQKALYECGADDVTDNTLSDEASALHIKSLLRRTMQDTVAVRVIGETVFRRDTLTVSHSKGAVALSPLEFGLLSILLQNPGQAFNHEQLGDVLWGYTDSTHPETLDCHMDALCKKLADCTDFSVDTLCGAGYTLTLKSK